MLIDFNTVLKDIEDNDIENTVIGKTEPEKLTLKKVCSNALMALDEEKNAQTKNDRFLLGLKINSDESKVDLKAEQIAMLKALVGKIYSPLIVGRTWQLLEKE